jgi:hypothetical protein
MARFYEKLILPTNQAQATMCPFSQSQTPNSDPSVFSLGTQASLVHNQSQPLCVMINNNVSNQSTGPQMHLHRRTPSNTSSTTDNRKKEPPRNLMSNLSSAVDYGPTEAAPPPPNPRQENSLALAQHLFSHVKHLCFNKKAEVNERFCSHIGVNNLWKSNPISLMNTASTKLYHLCPAQCMTIGHNFCHSLRCKKILNLKSKIRGACNCNTRFLRFSQSI